MRVPYAAMSNVLGDDKQQQVLGLGRLGWSLRRIQKATGVRRETASEYLKAAGIPVQERGGRPRVWPPAKPATTGEVSTDPPPANPATTRAVSTDPPSAKPATTAELSTDLPPEFQPPSPAEPMRAPSARRQVPHLHVLEHPLAQRRHGALLGERARAAASPRVRHGAYETGKAGGKETSLSAIRVRAPGSGGRDIRLPRSGFECACSHRRPPGRRVPSPPRSASAGRPRRSTPAAAVRGRAVGLAIVGSGDRVGQIPGPCAARRTRASHSAVLVLPGPPELSARSSFLRNDLRVELVLLGSRELLARVPHLFNEIRPLLVLPGGEEDSAQVTEKIGAGDAERLLRDVAGKVRERGRERQRIRRRARFARQAATLQPMRREVIRIAPAPGRLGARSSRRPACWCRTRPLTVAGASVRDKPSMADTTRALPEHLQMLGPAAENLAGLLLASRGGSILASVEELVVSGLEMLYERLPAAPRFHAQVIDKFGMPLLRHSREIGAV